MGMNPSCLWAGLALLLGACAQAQAPKILGAPVLSAPASEADLADRGCRTASAMIAFDFEGASASACAISGEREFTILVTPEHAPPINPSPWYAFRYESVGEAPVTVTLHYLGGKHRYAPKWSDDSTDREIPVTLSGDGATAVMRLPSGTGTVSAQELITTSDHRTDLLRWSAASGAQPLTLGRSHDGRPVEALRLGREDAPRLVVLLGRQHPPEVTGANAMEAFVDELVAMIRRDPALEKQTQFLIVPLLNPDGVAHGHWRANRGGSDLNRDWGIFAQPETRAVKSWLDTLPEGVRPVLMLDFHSTRENLFYVQGDEASAAQQRFLAAWLGGRQNALPGYRFAIEPRDTNPGSGTAKNWFNAAYSIPAYTYEVADTVDRAAARAAARQLAADLALALKELGN